MIFMVLKNVMHLPTPEQAMDHLLVDETTASVTNGLGDASMGANLVN
jgi:hypothetical protein